MIHWFTTRVPLVLFSPPVPLPRAVKIPENNSTWKSPFECGSSRLSQSPQIHTTWPSMTCESYRKWLATFALLLNMQNQETILLLIVKLFSKWKIQQNVSKAFTNWTNKYLQEFFSCCWHTWNVPGLHPHSEIFSWPIPQTLWPTQRGLAFA